MIGRVIAYYRMVCSATNPVDYEVLSNGMASALEHASLVEVLTDLLSLEVIRIGGTLKVWKTDVFIFD